MAKEKVILPMMTTTTTTTTMMTMTMMTAIYSVGLYELSD
jgi:hypothetical protein